MKKPSRAGGKPAKARPHSALKPRGRNAAKPQSTRRSAADNSESVVAQLKRELHEALEQQTATSEVLQVISSSPGKLDRVFTAMLANATRICEAQFGNFMLHEGSTFRAVAWHGEPTYVDKLQREPLIIISDDTRAPLARLIETKEPVHVADLRSEPAYKASSFAPLVTLIDSGGARTLLLVPMLKENTLVGAISIYRREVRPFSDRQIELVQNFANQAVIAIENTRLLNELRQRTTDLTQRSADLTESLEQQTATSEILGVISSSPTNVQPVLGAIVRTAVTLCESHDAVILLRDGDHLRIAAHYGPMTIDFERALIGRDWVSGRVVMDRVPVHVHDLTAEGGEFPLGREIALRLNQRTVLGLPLSRERQAIGCLFLRRTEVRPFSEKQIALLQTFADQAVIAIENARLFAAEQQRTSELTELLEQQTATSEVLQVISSSPGDLQPVFEAMLEKAVRICDAKFGTINRWDGEALHLVASHNLPPAFAEFRSRTPFRPGSGNPISRMLVTKTVSHIEDLAREQGYLERNASAVAAVELGGVRTHLVVPMLKDNELIGVVIVYRQEVCPFTDKQIELVKNFAAQAVIAIENARLLSELRESLQEQTATAEVLQVISGSPGDLEPVFATMLEKAVRICDATFGNIYRWDGDALQLVATHNTPLAYAEHRRHSPFRADQNNSVARMITSKKVVHLLDAAANDAYLTRSDPTVVAAVELGGIRSALIVPMLKEDELVGAFIVSRQEVRPFNDKQIALVTNFAAQAVIAIENTRLLNELRESLQEQTATSEVLQVISSSPGDLQPVFATMLENAVRICDAPFGNIYRWDGATFSLLAAHNTPPAFVGYRTHSPNVFPDPKTAFGRILATKTVVHIADAMTVEGYVERSNPGLVAAIELGGTRTHLFVPMLKEDELLGIFTIFRQEVRPFTDKQIELVQNFAAQAVIAIENTRLLNELRQRTADLSLRTADLTESLEQQTATSEVLQVISSSPGNVQPVFSTVLENAVRICEAKFGLLYLYEGGEFRSVAAREVPPAFAEALGKEQFPPAPGGVLDAVMKTNRTVHVSDLAATQGYLERHRRMVASVELGGIRTVVGVPMLRGDELVGVIGIYRQEVRPFTEKQIALLTNFAAQAVIAIDNTRLLNELRESLQEQTATSEVLQVISGSPGDLEPVFATMLEKAVHICDATFGNIYRWDGDALHLVATRNTPPAFAAEARRRSQYRADPKTVTGRMLETKAVVHIADLAAESAYIEERHPAFVAGVELGGVRTILAVPMLKEDELIGSFTVYRQEVRSFTGKQIALVTNFAAQAVIAIENARLLKELRERTDQLEVQSREVVELNQRTRTARRRPSRRDRAHGQAATFSTSSGG